MCVGSLIGDRRLTTLRLERRCSRDAEAPRGSRINYPLARTPRLHPFIGPRMERGVTPWVGARLLGALAAVETDLRRPPRGAIRQNADGSMVKLASVFQRAAKYVTETGKPAIFGIVVVSKKWYDGLPADLRPIVDDAAAIEATGINPLAITINERARQAWIDASGELISLPDEERTVILKILASVGEDVSRARSS
jgi:hypothetical protein